MKTKLPIFLLFLFSTGFLYAQQFEKSSSKELITKVKCFSSGKVEDFQVPARNISKSSKEHTAVFEITYTGFSEEAKAAFQAAADIWSNLISSPVPITIDARWESMEEGVLGSSGPPEVFRNFKNAPFKNTWYVPTIANRLSGYDLNPNAYDMIILFNSDYSWYLGTDGDASYTETDFITVVLHEIGHSLGFSSNAYKDGVDGGIGYYINDGGMASAFDHFMYNGGDSLLMDSNLFDNPSPELLAEFTSGDVFFDSPLSNAANGHTAAMLYAPPYWNGGSSISHLGEIYNRTENALMTYSIGNGESLHDPGPIAMGLFAEVGWVSVRFEHDHLKDLETMSNPATVDVEIYSDSSIISGSVFLHYSTDNFASDDNKVSMTTLNDTLYTCDIPVLVADTVWYYIEAKNNLDRNYFYPSQGGGSIDATFADSSLYFIIANDDINPELIYDQDVDYIFNFTEKIEIEVEADDNIGIDSVYIEYKLNDNTGKSIKLQYADDNPIGLPKYKIDLPLSDETLNNGDTIYFKFVAVDLSSNTNSTTLPESGYYKIVVHEIFAAETDAAVDFDEINDESLFIFNGLTISQPTNFDSKGLHSPHPYEEGDGYPNNEFIYTATLKKPIILNDTAKIRFEEIVIVEPGSGVPYGESDFWDYVVIQGSKDSGTTWHDFEDGYDCSIASSFTTLFNTYGVGSESKYLWHTISLVENPNLVAGDEVLIRFKLWSDQLAVGWGWAVDNIFIQGDLGLTTGVENIVNNTKHLTLYPNPATNGYFNLEFKSSEIINELNISIYSTDGKLVYSNNKLINDNSVEEQINVKNINTGIYIVKINTGKDIITERLLIK